MFRVTGLLAIWLSLGACVFEDEPAKNAKVRIGTYDSRGVAMAYAQSKFNPVGEKMAAYKKAKAAGDKAKMLELEAWGEQHQRQLHFQGFGRVPVDDLLLPVKDQVAELARARGLAAITMHCDFVGKDIELVDVTEDLAKLYNASDKALEMIRGIRKVKPASLTQLADMPAKH